MRKSLFCGMAVSIGLLAPTSRSTRWALDEAS